MKIGQIIRRKLKSGTPVGPYMKIVEINGGTVWAEMPNSKDKVILLKKDVYKPSTMTLYVSKQMLEALNNGSRICVTHPVCKRWFSVITKHIEIVKFRCKPEEYEHAFIIETCSTKYSLLPSFKEMLVKIVISYKLY